MMFIVPIVGIGLSPGSGIFFVSSLLKTLENWLFSTSALALRSVNTSFPTFRSWLSVCSFPSFLMCDQKAFGFCFIESPKKSDR